MIVQIINGRLFDPWFFAIEGHEVPANVDPEMDAVVTEIEKGWKK